MEKTRKVTSIHASHEDHTLTNHLHSASTIDKLLIYFDDVDILYVTELYQEEQPVDAA